MALDTGKIWIFGTLSLISFIAFSPQLFIIIPLFPDAWSDPECFRLLFPFNFLLGLLFLNYALCITTDPGQVPKEWDPFRLIDSEEENQAKKLLIGKLRFCRACKVYKPPRAHHCRNCKRCVLKMDHHCPWVNNCVGYYNYGHFIRFLWSVNVACWYHIWMISQRVFGKFAYGPEPKKIEMIFLILNYVACLPVILAVGFFSLYHLWALLSNATTIEGWEKEKAIELRRKGRINQFTYPFSLGAFRNVQAVLGSNPLLWWLPKKMSGDGLRYPVVSTLDPLEQYLWPPRDLFTRRDLQYRRMNYEREAFTHGHDQLNPNLIPTQSTTTDSSNHIEGINRRALPPYHLDWEEDDDSDSGRIANGHGSESDDEPLSNLVARRNGLSDHPGVVRRPAVRKGSEGLEVKAPLWSSYQFEVDGVYTPYRWPQEEGSEGSDGWD